MLRTVSCHRCFLIAGAWVLGVDEDAVDLEADLDNNPFKIVTSRCHPAQEWRAEIMRSTPEF